MLNKILETLSKHNVEQILINLLLTILLVLLSAFGMFAIFELNTQKAKIAYVLSEEQKDIIYKHARKMYEIGYFEGQKDVLTGDIRIKIINDSCSVWIKSPWDNVDSTSEFFKTIYNPSLKCGERLK